MKEHRFYILDVFAETKYAGNQLAVVRGAADLTDTEMQQIAKEMNYSETTFILSDEMENGGFNVRIFTPAEEVPFAGHPTLGTAYLIQQEIIGHPVPEVVLNLKCGQIPVAFTYQDGQPDVLKMKQLNAAFGRTFDTDLICEIIGVERRKLDERFAIQEVTTGLPFIIVPVKTLDTLKQVRIAKDRYFELVKFTEAKAILVFAPETETPGNNVTSRVFCDYYGIPEDPATGSANGCLAGYLSKNRFFDSDQLNIRVEQGAMVGRPSLLLLEAKEVEGVTEVYVGGKAVLVARGDLV